MSLYVEIEKRCGDFLLQVKFETGREVFAILGASGCGKSMTLKCIAGIEKPDRGIIRLGDKVLFDSQKRINLPARKRNIGYLFQDYALFPNMTVLQNIMCGARNREKAEAFVKRFFLEGREQLYPAQLSGGQKQRVAMARMLAAEPEIMMLDEPFSALDNHLKAMLERELMGDIEAFGKTVLFVSHDRSEAYRMTDRIAVMEEGRIVDIQPKKALFQAPGTLAAARLTGCKNITRLEKITQAGEEAPAEYMALDWGVRLRGIKIPEPGCHGCYAGLRAHHFEVVEQMEDTNVLECEVLRVIEDIYSVSVVFQNRGGSPDTAESVLTLELSREQWELLKSGEGREHTHGIFLKIPEDKLILLRNERKA